MERKTECEIVQDLLLGYVDGVLNAESKKLVEKHLSECEKCRKRLEDIRNRYGKYSIIYKKCYELVRR